MIETQIHIGPIRPTSGPLSKLGGAAISEAVGSGPLQDQLRQAQQDILSLQNQIRSFSTLLDQLIAVPMFIGSGPHHQAGVVPDPGATAGTTKFLRESGDFQNIDVPALPQMARALASKAAAQSIPNSTHTALAFDTDNVNVGGMHSTSVNNTRFTAATAGWHLAIGQAGFSSNAAGIRQISVAINGSFVKPIPASNSTPVAGFPTDVVTSSVLQLAIGDYVEFKAFQNTGGALNTDDQLTWGSLTFLGR